MNTCAGMTTENPGPRPLNVQAQLAKERNRAAAERTLMAWIRTCLTLISFGFGIDTIVSAILRIEGLGQVDPVRLSRLLGLAFVGLGTYAMLSAALEHQQELRHIQREEEYLYRPRPSLGLKVAIALIVIGVIAFGGIAWQAFTRLIT